MQKGTAAPLEHGGRLRRASTRYGIARDQWLDLSTGVSPWSWPVPPLPESVWQRLPEEEDALRQLAGDYYGLPSAAACQPLPVPGSQWAIEQLPQQLRVRRVLLPQRGYAEHRRAWLCAGHQLLDYSDTDSAGLEQRLRDDESIDCLLVINPNNPTATLIDGAQLLRYRDILARRGGWLVVDEAFIDTRAQHSIAPYSGLAGLVVLRSLGKFFGLAGLRLGFVLAPPAMLAQLAPRLSPWAVSSPARYIGCLALADRRWQQSQRQRLAAQAQQLREFLARRLQGYYSRLAASDLFVSVDLPRALADSLYEALAQRAVLLRYFALNNTQACLRFGLPGDQWAQFQERWDTLPALELMGSHCVTATVSRSID